MNSRQFRKRAHLLVQKAIAENKLARLDGSIHCVDCRKPASQYDHRDYSKPLIVDPVCRSCNAKRGKGFVPSQYSPANDKYITIPKVSDELRQAIRVAAAKAGKSTAAWVRQVLAQAAKQ